jgi:thiosulfate/3-mercaptopyruvate sulfurtransferase
MTFTTLISPAELRALIDDHRDPLILDCGFDLSDTAAGERAYAEGHIPGAHYLHLDRDLCGPKSGPDGAFRGRHPLPERETFATVLRRLGLRAGRQVVAYDRQGGPYAARAWWMLRWLGQGHASRDADRLAARGAPRRRDRCHHAAGQARPRAPHRRPRRRAFPRRG